MSSPSILRSFGRRSHKLRCEQLERRDLLATVATQWGWAPIGETFHPGDGITLFYTLENSSGFPEEEAGVLLSHDATIGTGDHVLTSQELSFEYDLAGQAPRGFPLPAASSEFWSRGDLPDGERTYYLGLYVKDEGVIRVLENGAITVEIEKNDIQMQSLVAQNGQLTLKYKVEGAPPDDEFEVSFVVSSDSTYGGGDGLLKRITLTGDDAKPGEHTLQLAIGGEDGQIPLPGKGSSVRNNDYFVLAVADPANYFQEEDNHPTSEDNTATLRGVYRNETTLSTFVHGTPQADIINVSGGSAAITLNGQSFGSYSAASLQIRAHSGLDKITYAAASGDYVSFWGGAADDQAVLKGTDKPDVARFHPGAGTLQGPDYIAKVYGMTSVTIGGNGGPDKAEFNGSAGADHLVAQTNVTTMEGPGYKNKAEKFPIVVAYAALTAGVVDDATLHGSANADTFIGRPTRSTLSGTGFDFTAINFQKVVGYGNGSNDTATFHDSAGNDTFSGSTARALLSGPGFSNWVSGFEKVVANANAGGKDKANLEDTTVNDAFVAGPTTARIFSLGVAFNHIVNNFDEVYARAIKGGADNATLNGSDQNDNFRGTPVFGRLASATPGFLNYAEGFDKVYAYGNGGNDQANFYDSEGNDVFFAGPNAARMTGSGYFHEATGFEKRSAYASAGGDDDRAEFPGTSGAETYTGKENSGFMQGGNYYAYAQGFKQNLVTGGAGDKGVLHSDDVGDTFTGRPTESLLRHASGVLHRLTNVRDVTANATARASANLFDSDGQDQLVIAGNSLTFTAGGATMKAIGFNTTTTSSGGGDHADLKGSAGDDTLTAAAWSISLEGLGFIHELTGFKTVKADGLGQSGKDHVSYTDSQGNDTVYVEKNWILIISKAGFNYELHNFEAGAFNASFAGTRGADTIDFYGDAGDLIANSQQSTMTLDGSQFTATGFESVIASALGTATLTGTGGDDSFTADEYSGILRTGAVRIEALDFALIRVIGKGGRNVATLKDYYYDLDLDDEWIVQ